MIASTIARLTTLGLVAGLLVTFVHTLTAQQIAQAQEDFETRQLSKVTGVSGETITVLSDGVFVTHRDEALTGYIFAGETNQGYNGLIRFWIAVSPETNVRGVRVIKHSETPGIGDFIETAVSAWMLTMDGRSLASNDWRLVRDGGDFDHVSGATITSRAMITGVASQLDSVPLRMHKWGETK